jgi:hypothetical protein
MELGFKTIELPIIKPKKLYISNNVMKMFLGGRWPSGKGTDWEGFGFDAVDHWELEEDGTIQPSDGCGGLCPGPGFMLVPVA